jgi:hypothetical protein
MRKQDRLAQQQQSRPQKGSDKQTQPGQRQQEQVKGSASQDQRPRPPRPGGRLPLPD